MGQHLPRVAARRCSHFRSAFAVLAVVRHRPPFAGVQKPYIWLLVKGVIISLGGIPPSSSLRGIEESQGKVDREAVCYKCSTRTTVECVRFLISFYEIVLILRNTTLNLSTLRNPTLNLSTTRDTPERQQNAHRKPRIGHRL